MWREKLPQAANVRPGGDRRRETAPVLCSACQAWDGKRLEEAVRRTWMSQAPVFRDEGGQDFMLLSRARYAGHGEMRPLFFSSYVCMYDAGDAGATCVLPDA